jgi:hypothetical protein
VSLSEGQGLHLKDNAVLRTSSGRAEVLLGPDNTLRVGENSSFRLVTSDLADTRIQLLSGALVVTTNRPATKVKLTLGAGESAISFSRAGFYHFDTSALRVRVFAGQAEAQTRPNSFGLPKDGSCP